VNALLLPRVVIPDLNRDPRSKNTTVRAEPVEACASLNVGGTSDKPGLAPAGDSLSLASPRESKQREGDPMVWDPSLRCGQPAVLAESGVELELATLRQSLALIHFRLRSSAQPDGWGNEQTPMPNAGRHDARSASGRSQAAFMFARGRSTHGQMKFPSIAQRGEGGVRGGSGELRLLSTADHTRSVTPKKFPPRAYERNRLSAKIPKAQAAIKNIAS
jgi:hypothetical protein